MVVVRSNEAALKKKSLLSEGIPDLSLLPTPDEKSVEMYALAAIIISDMWKDFTSFFESSPVNIEKWDGTDEYWDKIYREYLTKSVEFKNKVLMPKIQQLIHADRELSQLERAYVRYLYVMSEAGEKPLGMPSIDDMYFFGFLLFKMISKNQSIEKLRTVSISDVLIFFMSLGRPHLELLLYMLLEGNRPLDDQDMSRDFDFSKFKLEDNDLKINKELLDKWEKVLPVFLKMCSENGRSTRILKCPLLYSEPGLPLKLISFFTQEARSHI